MNILSDDIKILIRKLAIPASVGTLFQTLYNIVDTYFAGKISPEALSALTKSFPIYFILIASSIGVTVAGTSLIGNSIGEKNWYNSSVRNALRDGSSKNLVPNLMQQWITNDVFRPTLKQRRIYEATLFGMPDMYDLQDPRNTPRANGMGWGILANRLRRKQYEYFAADGMRTPGGVYISRSFMPRGFGSHSRFY